MGISLYFKDSIIDSLRTDLIEANIETQQEKANNRVLNAEISKQNTLIEQNKIDYDSKVKEFENWKKEPIYRTIIKEVKSDECEDIKSMLDDIRNSAF